MPNSPTPASDLDSSLDGPLTFPSSHPQLPQQEEEAGRFHPFLKGSGG